MTASRTITAPYVFPPARLTVDASELDDHDTLDIVAKCLRDRDELYALCGSMDHVRRILELVSKQDTIITAQAAELRAHISEHVRTIRANEMLSRALEQSRVALGRATTRRDVDREFDDSETRVAEVTL